MSDLLSLSDQIMGDIDHATNLEELENIRVKVLGKNGQITHLLKNLTTLDPESRKIQGVPLNSMKNKIIEAISERQQAFKFEALAARLKAEKMDITLPVRPSPLGKLHPLTQGTKEILTIFQDMGFAIEEGPEIEDDYHNFTALNIGPDHPSRQMMDTFYLPGTREGRPLVLRTHTSCVQIRTMMQKKPPLRIIAPGRVYRSDLDQTQYAEFSSGRGIGY